MRATSWRMTGSWRRPNSSARPSTRSPAPEPAAAMSVSPGRTASPARESRSSGRMLAADPELPNEPAESMVRSLARVVSTTGHPSPTSPMRLPAGTRAEVKNTSLKMARPVISRIGRTSMPGWSMSMTKYERPWCLGSDGLVRAMRMPKRAAWAPEVQTF